MEHPRVCGENQRHPVRNCLQRGTSPRMRGKLSQAFLDAFPSRNIPAYAGKTFPVSHKTSPKPEHPRVCGENILVVFGIVCCWGTSPRMRGKLHSLDPPLYSGGNIPAYAGKTLIDVRFLVPEGHFTFGFVFLHRGGSVESPCSSLFSECFSARIVVYGQLGTSLLSAYGCAFWWDGG